MKRVYDTGLVDNNQLSTAVNVITAGAAYSAVYLLRSGGQFNLIDESTSQRNNPNPEKPANGDILTLPIGLASKVRKSYIVVRTLINMSHLDDDLRKREVELIRIDYSFSGGFSDNQVYNFDNDDITVSPDYKMVSITKPVEMI
ncbi:hypothetical protein [Spirosoma fluviale]|uniref:Uncharacterized protein n=1 Tax=Spirosoma fluviale TaxID=1597977 RepID=A0A286FCN5_9BACT|nr:hypothetical protein [Spirosoma fluviale]SOD80960.1 hypothetical protein SAMN06269250_1625 [Spirosoma fluviale]